MHSVKHFFLILYHHTEKNRLTTICGAALSRHSPSHPSPTGRRIVNGSGLKRSFDHGRLISADAMKGQSKTVCNVNPLSWQPLLGRLATVLIASAHAYAQAGDSLVTTFVNASYRSYIMSGCLVPMCSAGITLRIVHLYVSI